MGLNKLDLAIIALYLVGITLFGLRFRKKQRTLRDYFLAGRDIPWWAIALSIVAAETSTLTIISIPGLAYDTNLTFLQVVMGYVVGRVVISFVLLPHYFRGDLYTAYELIERRCTRCHALEQVTAARKDPEGWLETVKRMRAMPDSDIWDGEAKVILSYLLAEQPAASSSTPEAGSSGKELVDSHCATCHTLDRVYQAAKNPAAWRKTVTRMKTYARGTKGAFTARDGEGIVEFLSAARHPQGQPANPVRVAAFTPAAGAVGAAEAAEPGGALPRPALILAKWPATVRMRSYSSCPRSRICSAFSAIRSCCQP